MKIPANARTQTQTEKSFIPAIEKVAIVGAGLGGLAVAVALQKLGCDVQVYEKVQDFRPVGGGLGLLPNGLNFLDAIEPGIVETIKNSGCEVSRTVLKNTLGETISTNPGGRYQDKYDQTFVTIWWWRLQQILAAKLPPENIHLNHRCIGFEQDEHSVSIYFEHGKQVNADLLIGADGINSAVRAALIGDGKPRYLGSMSWRTAIACHQEVLHPGELGFVKGEGEFMYLLNVGGGYISWLYRKLLPDCDLSQNTTQSKSRVLEHLSGWGEPLRELVATTPAEQILEAPICDRLPLTSWSRGRVTLLGDAAHPMAPALAQGSNSTFEDAYELAFCLTQASSLQAALATYEQSRIPRTELMQTRSALGEMRYYTADSKAVEQQMQEQSQMSRAEFDDWVFNYKPHRNLI